MFVPLPKELDDALKELAECGPYVDEDQYTSDETSVMEKLRVLGLVSIGWVLTPAGKQRLRQEKEWIEAAR